MEDYLNLYVRKRTIVVDGKFYESYFDYYSVISKETIISNENYKPPIETEALLKGTGWSSFKTDRRRFIYLKLPILPSTVDLSFRYFLVTLSSKHFL